jgi:hypothetical protein
MHEEIDGYRRTSFRTKLKHVLSEKLELFKDRGEETTVIESAGYFYIYVKKEQPLHGEKQ